MVLLGYCARCACNYVCDFNCSPKETRKTKYGDYEFFPSGR